MRLTALLGFVATAASVALVPRDAEACGGCFTPPTPTEIESVITDEKMILSISMNQTTLYDQINYSGAPSSFAWVLPIKGTVTVGLSADVLFQVINQLTATEVEAPPTNCPPPPNCYGPSASLGTGEGVPDNNGGGGGVTVTSQKQVGPYETVQLHSTDGSALTDWLTAHGYQIPASTKPIINAYVSQQFDFLALKLVPGAGVQSMQPVRVTSQGASPSLPLHMVAIGTGATTGITIWVVADGRWAPSNFPTFTIADSEISWDWATESSNYETLRLAKEATFGGRGWQIESSLELAQNTIQQTLFSNVEYGGQTGSYLPQTGDAGAASDAGEQEAGDDAGTEVVAAGQDLDVLFAGVAQPNVRITRMRSDVAQSALSVDMALAASSDQSEMSNIHVAQQQIGEPQCPVYNSSCVAVGTLPRSQAQAQASQSGGSSPSASGGCSTTEPPTNTGPTIVFLLGLGGLTAFRIRQKRRTR
jgi:MYXO-CTERM domain-containing protein